MLAVAAAVSAAVSLAAATAIARTAAVTLADAGAIAASITFADPTAITTTQLAFLQLTIATTAAATRLVVSQRLVRLLCKECKEEVEANTAERELLGFEPTGESVMVCRSKGCEECKYTGYRGRVGVYELIEIDDATRMLIYDGASEQDILHLARQNYPGIEADGRRRVLAGETSIHEVLRVTSIS